MIYIAGSFNTPEKRAYITRLAEKLRKEENKIGSLMILNNDRVYSYEEFIYNDKLVPIDIEQK